MTVGSSQKLECDDLVCAGTHETGVADHLTKSWVSARCVLFFIWPFLKGKWLRKGVRNHGYQPAPQRCAATHELGYTIFDHFSLENQKLRTNWVVLLSMVVDGCGRPAATHGQWGLARKRPGWSKRGAGWLSCHRGRLNLWHLSDANWDCFWSFIKTEPGSTEL